MYDSTSMYYSSTSMYDLFDLWATVLDHNIFTKIYSFQKVKLLGIQIKANSWENNNNADRKPI